MRKAASSYYCQKKDKKHNSLSEAEWHDRVDKIVAPLVERYVSYDLRSVILAALNNLWVILPKDVLKEYLSEQHAEVHEQLVYDDTVPTDRLKKDYAELVSGIFHWRPNVPRKVAEALLDADGRATGNTAAAESMVNRSKALMELFPHPRPPLYQALSKMSEVYPSHAPLVDMWYYSRLQLFDRTNPQDQENPLVGQPVAPTQDTDPSTASSVSTHGDEPATAPSSRRATPTASPAPVQAGPPLERTPAIHFHSATNALGVVTDPDESIAETATAAELNGQATAKPSHEPATAPNSALATSVGSASTAPVDEGAAGWKDTLKWTPGLHWGDLKLWINRCTLTNPTFRYLAILFFFGLSCFLRSLAHVATYIRQHTIPTFRYLAVPLFFGLSCFLRSLAHVATYIRQHTIPTFRYCLAVLFCCGFICFIPSLVNVATHIRQQIATGRGTPSLPAYRDVQHCMDYHFDSVVGQDHVVEAVRHRLNVKLHDPDVPLRMHFGGDNGVGKTHLAKQISLITSQCVAREHGENLLIIYFGDFQLDAELKESKQTIIRRIVHHLQKFPHGVILLDHITLASVELIDALAPLFGGGPGELTLPGEDNGVSLDSPIIIITSDFRAANHTRGVQTPTELEHEIQQQAQDAYDIAPVHKLDTFAFWALETEHLLQLVELQINRLPCRIPTVRKVTVTPEAVEWIVTVGMSYVARKERDSGRYANEVVESTVIMPSREHRRAVGADVPFNVTVRISPWGKFVVLFVNEGIHIGGGKDDESRRDDL